MLDYQSLISSGNYLLQNSPHNCYVRLGCFSLLLLGIQYYVVQSLSDNFLFRDCWGYRFVRTFSDYPWVNSLTEVRWSSAWYYIAKKTADGCFVHKDLLIVSAELLYQLWGQTFSQNYVIMMNTSLSQWHHWWNYIHNLRSVFFPPPRIMSYLHVLENEAGQVQPASS